MAELSRTPRLSRGERDRSHTPHSRQLVAGAFGLGCFLFARRYSGNPNWFLFLPLLRCFSSGGSRSSRSGGRSRQEVLFRDPRIEDCMRLPGAYRSLPRPSSAPKPSHPTGSVVYQQISRSHGWSRKSMHGFIENWIQTPGILSLALHSSIVSGRELHWISLWLSDSPRHSFLRR